MSDILKKIQSNSSPFRIKKKTMGNILTNVSQTVFNGVLNLINKTIRLFWKTFAYMALYIEYPRVNRRRPHDINITRYEQFSRYLGSIRLNRYETDDETFIYATYFDDHWGEIFKGLLFEQKGIGGRTEFYMYAENSENGLIEAVQMPVPINVSFLDKIFDYETEQIPS